MKQVFGVIEWETEDDSIVLVDPYAQPVCAAKEEEGAKEEEVEADAAMIAGKEEDEEARRLMD